MLGSALALQRGEHMRLALGRGRISAAWQQRLGTLAIVVTILFAAEIMLPAWHYQVGQAVIETPGLGIPGSWRAMSLFAGFGLILLLSLCSC